MKFQQSKEEGLYDGLKGSPNLGDSFNFITVRDWDDAVADVNTQKKYYRFLQNNLYVDRWLEYIGTTDLYFENGQKYLIIDQNSEDCEFYVEDENLIEDWVSALNFKLVE